MNKYEQLNSLARQFPRGTLWQYGTNVGRVTGFTWSQGAAHVNQVGGRGHFPALVLPGELGKVDEGLRRAQGWLTDDEKDQARKTN